jgi:type IV secretion system protein VirB6/type IV secretion system protein TrbL
MERNANDTFGGNTGESSSGGYGTGSAGSANSPSSFGAGSASTGGASGTGTSDASFSRDSSTDAAGLADRAKTAASTAGEKLSDVGSSVRDRAGSLKQTLADALESGAEKLRAQGAGGGQIAGSAATGGSGAMVSDGNRLSEATNQLAGGLQASADWLRDADLDGLKSGVERQVKEHPGRTLAVAVGLGYLLGKAFKK